MGRKIPGRKHHGVKDPEKQRIERENKIQNKINAPPANPDEQHVPKSLTRVIELKNKAKNMSGKKRSKNPSKNSNPEFEQFPGETNRHFLYRINKICERVKREAAFENKYGVEIRRNDSGKVEDVVKRPKDPLELMLKQARNDRRAKTNKNQTDTPKLSKSQKKQLRIAEKKLKKTANNVKDFDHFTDNVKFGEQVHGPPSLTVLPKNIKHTEAPRPGRKELLLTSLLKNNNVNAPGKVANKTEHKPGGISNRAINKKGKRKDLPNALRRQLDMQQKEVIEAYKHLKKAQRITYTN